MKHAIRFKRAAAVFLAAMMLLVSLASCGKAKVVGTCQGLNLYEDEYSFVVSMYRQGLEDAYGEDIWGTDEAPTQYDRMLRDLVLENLTYNFSVILLAQDVGLHLDDEDVKDQVNVKLTSAKQSLEMSGTSYKEFLKEHGMTDRYYRYILGCDVLESALIDTYANALGIIPHSGLTQADRDSFADYAMEGNFVLTYHVFVRNDEGEDPEDNRKRAEKARELLLSGEKTITQMIASAYNEDVFENTPYCFTYGEMDLAYEQAAFSLEVGKVSEVVEGKDGFYVIVRQEMTRSYVETNLSDLLAQYQYQKMQEIIREKQTGLKIELNEEGKKLHLLTEESEQTGS